MKADIGYRFTLSQSQCLTAFLIAVSCRRQQTAGNIESADAVVVEDNHQGACLALGRVLRYQCQYWIIRHVDIYLPTGVSDFVWAYSPLTLGPPGRH